MDYMNGWAGRQFLIVIRAKGPIWTRPVLRQVWEHIVPSSASLKAAEVRQETRQAAGTSRDGQAAARKLARLQLQAFELCRDETLLLRFLLVHGS